MPFQAFKIDSYFITFWKYRPVRDAKCPVRDAFFRKPSNIFEKFLLEKLNNKIIVGNKSYVNGRVYRSQPDCKTIGCVQVNANYPYVMITFTYVMIRLHICHDNLHICDDNLHICHDTHHICDDMPSHM